MQLQKLRSTTICLPAGDPERLMVSFQSEPKGLRSRRTDDVSPSPKAGKDPYPSSSFQAEKANSFSLCLCSIQALNTLHDATHIGEDIFFTQSDSNANVSEDIRHTQK